MCGQHKTKFQGKVFTIDILLYIRNKLDKIVDSSSANTLCYFNAFQYSVAFANKAEHWL